MRFKSIGSEQLVCSFWTTPFPRYGTLFCFRAQHPRKHPTKLLNPTPNLQRSSKIQPPKLRRKTGGPPTLEMHSDYPRPSYRGAQVTSAIFSLRRDGRFGGHKTFGKSVARQAGHLVNVQ